MADANHALLIFDEFLTHLRRQGFEIGVDHYLRLQELLLKIGTECEPQRLRTILCPIFVTNEVQQAQFYRAFDNYFSVFQSVPATTSAPTEEVGIPDKQKRKPARRSIWFYLAGVILLAALAGAAIRWRVGQNQPTPPPDNSQLAIPIPTQTQWPPLPTVRQSAGGKPTSNTPAPNPISQSRFERFKSAIRDFSLTLSRVLYGLAVLWLACLMPLTLFLFYDQPLPHHKLSSILFWHLRPLLFWITLLAQPFLWLAVLGLGESWSLRRSSTALAVAASLIFLTLYRQKSRSSMSATAGTRRYRRFRVAFLCLTVLASLALFIYELMSHWVAIFAPGIFFLIYEWHRFKNRQLLLRRQRGKKPPFVWPIRIKAFAPGLFDPDLFFQAANLMRRRQLGETYRLNVSASVLATAEARGYPTFRYKLDSKPPEYLILIERGSFRDHQAQLFNELTKALEREGIFVARYFYDRDPRVCCEEARGACLSLPELHSKFSGHRLLIFGNGDEVLDPITGALASWTTVFSGWRDRALLTPAAPAEWGFREISLASLFVVLPASLAGLLTLLTYFESLTETDVRAWRAKSTEKAPPLDAEPAAMIAALKSYLGESTFQWLCACAVYPELHWDLTLYVGSLSGMGSDLIREENLLRLIRLPWFRSGSIPDEVRWLLLRELDPVRERAVRLALIEVLEHDPPPGETYAADAYQLNLVVQRWLSRRERERRRELLAALPNTARQQLTADYTTLRFLEAEPVSALNVYLPARLRRAFYQNGIAAFGLKTGARLLMVIFVVIMGFGAREARKLFAPEMRVDVTITTPPTPPQPGMVYVPGGTFMMGRDDGDDAERPAHQVTLSPFFIDRYEVTNEDYQKFVRATGYRAPNSWTRGVYPADAVLKPVTGVTWDDANAYASWARKRLPTEEEWEFAARGTDGRIYPWGNTWQAGGANANGASQAMAMVGSYQLTSPFGAYDMVGNAWEWTASNFRAYPGQGSPRALPSGDLRVIRGGCYESTKDYATTTYRAGWPARGAPTYDQTGFRCAADVADSSKDSPDAEAGKLRDQMAKLQDRIAKLKEAANAELVGATNGSGRSGSGPRYQSLQDQLFAAEAELAALKAQLALIQPTLDRGFSTSFHQNADHSSRACSSCHQRYADNDTGNSLPVHKACTNCHFSQFSAPNSAMCALCHTQIGWVHPPVNYFPPLLAFETKFDHSRHNTGVALPAKGCNTCHQINSGKVVSTLRGLDAHTACYACHTPTAQSNGRDIATCGVCHVLRAAPPK